MPTAGAEHRLEVLRMQFIVQRTGTVKLSHPPPVTVAIR